MTNEEKAKAYDEAVNKIKPLYEQAKRDGNPIWSTYEYLIPELAESEDERIRSEIIDYLGLVGKGDGDYAQPMIDRWIAWLEQQECGEKGLKGPQEIGDWRGDEGVCKKQKEQKPAEWNEEDERMLSRCVKSIESSKQFADTDTFKKAKDNEIDWLKNRFKFLGLQSKPIEWSEEDELMCNNILNLLCSQITYVTGQGTTSGKQYPTYSKERDWFINCFKSLRPSWKPSEEQLNALNFAITYMFSTKANPTVLRDLYNDLLKLK